MLSPCVNHSQILNDSQVPSAAATALAMSAVLNCSRKSSGSNVVIARSDTQRLQSQIVLLDSNFPTCSESCQSCNSCLNSRCACSLPGCMERGATTETLKIREALQNSEENERNIVDRPSFLAFIASVRVIMVEAWFSRLQGTEVGTEVGTATVTKCQEIWVSCRRQRGSR